MHGNRPTEPQLQVVITGGWCVLKKKRNIHTEDTTSHGEKKRKRIKKGKKEEVPSTGIELANLTGWCDGFTAYATAALIRKEHSRYLSVPHLISAG